MSDRAPTFGLLEDLLNWAQRVEARLDRLERAFVAQDRPSGWASPETIAREYGIPLPTLRGWLHHRGTNGLDQAVSRKGRRLYVAREAFEAWFRAQTEP